MTATHKTLQLVIHYPLVAELLKTVIIQGLENKEIPVIQHVDSPHSDWGSAGLDMIVFDEHSLERVSLQHLQSVRAVNPAVVMALLCEPTVCSVSDRRKVRLCTPLSSHSAMDDLAVNMRRLLGGQTVAMDCRPAPVFGRQPANHYDTRAAAKHLSPAKTRVLDLMLSGLSNKEIARSLSLSESTVKSHLSFIYKSLQLRSRTAAISALGARPLSVTPLTPNRY